MNQRLFVNLQNRDNCGIVTLSFIWRSGCYANNLDMELCIKFLTCAIDLDDIYKGISWSLELLEAIWKLCKDR